MSKSGVRCYDNKGALKWEHRIPTPGVNYGHPNSPIVADDKVILNLDYGADTIRRLMTLNKNTGEVIWKSLIQMNSPLVNFGFPGFSTPVLYQDQVIIHRCGGIASYSLKDGTPVWWYSILTNGVSTPVIKNNIVYAGAWMEFSESERRGDFFKYDTFEKVITDFDQNKDSLLSLAEIPENLMVFIRPGIEDIENTQWAVRKMFNGIDADKNGLINEKEWMDRYKLYSGYVQDFGLFAIPATLKGELSAEDVLWMQMEKNPEVPSPLALDDCIYMVKDGGWVTCMDAKTGKVHYQEKLGAPGACIASPVAANGYIYLSSHNGTIKVIKADKKPQLVSETKLEGKILATPAIVGNTLYVRTSEHLYAFYEK